MRLLPGARGRAGRLHRPEHLRLPDVAEDQGGRPLRGGPQRDGHGPLPLGDVLRRRRGARERQPDGDPHLGLAEGAAHRAGPLGLAAERLELGIDTI